MTLSWIQALLQLHELQERVYYSGWPAASTSSVGNHTLKQVSKVPDA